MSLPQIGQLLGGRDHTTVIHGVDKVTHLLADDETVRKQITDVRTQLVAPK